MLPTVPLTGEEKQSEAPRFYVKKSTWQETMLASRARLAKAKKEKQEKVKLGLWHTTGPLTAETFDVALFPEVEVDLMAMDEHDDFLWNSGRDSPDKGPDAELMDVLQEDRDEIDEADEKDEEQWPDGQVHVLHGGESVSTYLFRTIETEKPVKLAASFGSSDGLAVWLNGAKLLSRDVVRTARPDQDWVDLDLMPGENQLLVKIFNSGGQQCFFFSIERGPAFRVWQEMERDFPVQANWMKRDLDGRHLSWFTDVDDVETERAMIVRALGDVAEDGAGLRSSLVALVRAKARPDDRRWLDLYVSACWFHRATAMLARLSHVLDEIGELSAEGLHREINDLRKANVVSADRRWLDICVKTFAVLGRLRAVRTRMAELHPRLKTLNPRSLRHTIQTYSMSHPPRYKGVPKIFEKLAGHEKRLQEIELALMNGDDTPMSQVPEIVEELLPLASPNVTATGWPVFRGDNFRSGYSIESLPAKLSVHWTYKARHGPHPAWTGRDTRMHFDHAYHTVIADGVVFFGSSADCKVYALDADTGTERWTFFTGGPVRFAPAVWKSRVFVVSDDGFLYCLSAKDGKVLWQRRGGPENDLVVGNGRMLSRWPARGAPVIYDSKVYFAAGIWPSEGIYVYALDAATGKVLWVNDSSGGLVMEQPHGGNRARSGISAQGYLAADRDRVFVPTGRGVPAVFDRATGKLLYFFLAANRGSGGSDIVLGDNMFFNGDRAFDARTGSPRPSMKGRPTNRTVVFPEGIASSGEGQINTYRPESAELTDRKGNPRQSKALVPSRNIPSAYRGTSLIMAGQTVISAGKEIVEESDAAKAAPDDEQQERNGVSVAGIGSDEPGMSAAVEGVPLGLAVADKRLYVSTDKGTIVCYGPAEKPAQGMITPETDGSPYGDNELYSKAAEEIIKETGVVEGYCLDLGCGDGALAYALARRTKLHILAIDKDPNNVALARKRLDIAGLHGVRVTVHQGNPARTPYPTCFANLVVSRRSVTEGTAVVPAGERGRLTRPYGGVACFGKLGAMKKIVRGALKDAGEWTHQYANPASTLCSDDRLAKGPLAMRWFADFGFQMPNRHGRGPAPLFKDGVLVIEGVHGLLAADAYNGRQIWRLPIKGILQAYDQEHLMGAAGTNSNMCLAGDSIFLRIDNRCLRLSLTTGEKTQEYFIPEKADIKPDEKGSWGFVASVDGMLFGSAANKNYIVRALHSKARMESLLTQSGELFALDIETGKQKWAYRARYSLRHNAIVIGGGRVYLIDSLPAEQDRSDFKKRRGIEEKKPDPAPSRPILLCLDARTGKTLWETSKDIYGTMLSLSTRHDVLVMGYQYSQRSFQFGSEKGNRLTGLRASTGTRLWDAEGPYLSRPLINGRTVYTQPHRRDLLTGKRDDDFVLEGRGPGGCGTISGSAHLLLYRSGPLGYTDLLRNVGTENYGGPRPGCWINAIPAGGLVFMPDATDRCSCSYLMKVSIALQPRAAH